MKKTLAMSAMFAALLLIFGSFDGCSTRNAPSASRVRAQKDTVGYATRPEQVDALVRLVDSLEARRYASNEAAFPRMGTAPMIGAICPHDDYLYAGRGYVHAMRFVKARTVVLFGVSHTARRRGIRDRLIFDDYSAWKVGGRACRVSPLRDEIVAALPPELVLVNDTILSEEHSLEGFVPMLQHFDPRVEIVPILVTRLGPEIRERSADTLAAILAERLGKRGWRLGENVQVLISADAVHYGDEEWGGRNYAPFGVDSAGYEKGVAQDLDVVRTALTGPMTREKIDVWREKVDSGDFHEPYKITWCGIYSIPFGLGVLERLCDRARRAAPEGFMLVYGTSIDPKELPLETIGLGTTAIATLRHWVGYTAVGYW